MKAAVVYWSSTGNTEAMANAVLEGAKTAGIDADLIPAGEFSGLFGSYGWGDGQWMRDWQERSQADGAVLVAEPVIANEDPDDDAIAACKALGAALA